jgi:hypothetical protein
VCNGGTLLSLDSGQVCGRVVRFWRGDGVLELECVGPNLEGRGGSRARLSRRHEIDLDVLAGCCIKRRSSTTVCRRAD